MSKLNERELTERFEEMLDQAELVNICGYEYEPSQALKAVDPVAYRQEYLNWLDAECQNESLYEHNDEYYTEDGEWELDDESANDEGME